MPCASHSPERAALAELQGLGLRDVVRDRWPNERVHLLGLPGGHVPSGPRDADRPRRRRRSSRRAAHRPGPAAGHRPRMERHRPSGLPSRRRPPPWERSHPRGDPTGTGFARSGRSPGLRVGCASGRRRRRRPSRGSRPRCRSRPPASTIVPSDAAMPRSSRATTPARPPHRGRSIAVTDCPVSDEEQCQAASGSSVPLRNPPISGRLSARCSTSAPRSAHASSRSSGERGGGGYLFGVTGPMRSAVAARITLRSKDTTAALTCFAVARQ